MKVLFVTSYVDGYKISHALKNQAHSLEKRGVLVDFFLIRNKGIVGYLLNVFHLRRYLKKNKFDIIHAHYAFRGYVSTLAGAKPLVVSLMGSDIKAEWWYKYIANFFINKYWDKTIVKSIDLMNTVGCNKVEIIPNGVNLERFKVSARRTAKQKVEFDENKKYLIWISNPKRSEKNFKLAEDAVKLLNREDVELIDVYNKPNELLPYYYNAADALLLTSLWEGSPNVIKEAMACNCPLVSTDVGDVSHLIEGVQGCYLAEKDANDFAEKIKKALVFGQRTKGREKIIELGIDSESIARKIVEFYQEVIDEGMKG